MPIIEDHETLRMILQESKIIAVVGISPQTFRPSHFVSAVVKRYGFRMYLVNPNYAGQEILGEKVLASLDEVPEDIDIVNVFRRASEVPIVALKAKEKGFKTFWLQPGTENPEVVRELDQEGFNVIPGLCLKTCCHILL